MPYPGAWPLNFRGYCPECHPKWSLNFRAQNFLPRHWRGMSPVQCIARLGGLQSLPSRRSQRSYNEKRKGPARTDFLILHGQVGHRSLLLRLNDGSYGLLLKMLGPYLRHFLHFLNREHGYLGPQYVRFYKSTAKREDVHVRNPTYLRSRPPNLKSVGQIGKAFSHCRRCLPDTSTSL